MNEAHDHMVGGIDKREKKEFKHGLRQEVEAEVRLLVPEVTLQMLHV